MSLPCNTADSAVWEYQKTEVCVAHIQLELGRLSEPVPGWFCRASAALMFAAHEAEAAVFKGFLDECQCSACVRPGTAGWSSEYHFKLKWVQERRRA